MGKLFFPVTKVAIAVLSFLIPLGRTNGCGIGFGHEEYRIAWFNPLLINDPALRPFYFNTYFEFQFPADPERLDYQRNCQEWAAYLGAGVKEADVMQILYKIGPELFLNLYDDGQLGTYFPNNTFIQQITQPERAETLSYLVQAMRAEFAHFSDNDPWGLDEKGRDFFQQITPIILNARQKVKDLKDPFLQRRYAYQLVVQYRYAENADECSRYCDEFFAWDSSPSILIPWAQYFKAESLASQSNFAEANYLLCKVFDQCESKKLRVFQLFNREKMAETLQLAQNPQEEAVIQSLAALMNPGQALDQIKEVIRLAPTSRYLPQLITREINKLEDWILTPRLTFFEGGLDDFSFDEEDPSSYMPGENSGLLAKEIPYLTKNLTKDRNYLQNLVKTLSAWSQNPNLKHPDFAHLAMAQLYYLNQQPNEAEAALKKISPTADQRVELQKRLIQLLILPQQVDINQAEVQNKIAQELNQLIPLLPQSEAELRLYPKLMLYYSRMFQQKGNAVLAGLFYNRSQSIPKNTYASMSSYYTPISYFDRFASLAELDALITLIQKKEGSPLENRLLQPLNKWEKNRYYLYGNGESYDTAVINVTPSLEQLYDLKGTIAFRQNRLELALAAFEHLPDDYWAKNYDFKYHLSTDPFATPQSYPWDGQQQQVNKKLVLKRMLDLQKQAEIPGPQQAEACYLLGNAYFNFTYWGRNWMMFSYGKSVSELYTSAYSSLENFSFSPNAELYFKEYFRLSRANAYYQKAFQAKPGEDLAARITFMLGTCDKYAHHNFDVPYWEEEEEPYFSPIFNTFRDQFAKTEVFQECLNTCPELADYYKKN